MKQTQSRYEATENWFDLGQSINIILHTVQIIRAQLYTKAETKI